ncbi:hypothetical protein LX16_4547 [Stackebrandtia albiflava]|uniref:Uncharacterized protein n=1 Tax=Stackebrandtia albiflava TaxID=406432 RepID=A0A562URT4_9ACTN|nr:hypothetical protein [Stackebrandtia albiflava]TWJ08321.1 hypothetical protein LX16_4547 [Stackebrandtia albiflava]
MPRRALTSEWSIDIDDSFRGRVVAEDLQLVSPGPPVRTIWVAVWRPSAERSVAELTEFICQNVHPDPVRRFEEPGSDPEERRYGSWYPETVEERTQWGLYGYTIRRGRYVQSAYLTDEPSDLDWALGAWRSLRFEAGDA